MKKTNFLILFILSISVLSFTLIIDKPENSWDEKILNYEVDLKHQNLDFYWQDNSNENYRSFQNLKSILGKENKELIFAMNGGMYTKDLSPQGLYIEKGVVKQNIDTIDKGYGNFYLQPNGVFYITKEQLPVICTTKDFIVDKNIWYATQSGPMLIIDGSLHSAFNKGSANKHIRNGVGILPNGNLLFAISKEKINFYDFASYFKGKGCKNALYLDGFVSRAYLPSKNWEQLEGNFGVIIAETKLIK
ncbi:phosphodiester glycosidase family protein [Aquimarina sp. 2201CG5-10]|uniref:phosphodiester glycosidase family protein n=1 Tax=Aquimarina callyspongiae TaxID=3098150 RepID=UPI002AB5D7A6|nr:phosphodiester glycosidase family protein [Aquimarina sp. 2201CG5-10]MDY8135694.1 phosphodiester glycosidase family protein [Aquimarina sp. 2201CG5-10]